jgi:hypothetical protein
MNHNQFDDLTRKLANGVSRREFLKTLALGVVSVVLPWSNVKSAIVATSRGPCNQQPPYPPNPDSNKLGTDSSCSDFNARLRRGTAYYQWEPDPFDPTMCKYEEGFDSEAHGGITVANFSVGEFTFQYETKRQAKGWTAGTTAPVKFSVSMLQTIYKLTWAGGCTCSDYNRVQGVIETHERHHFQDNENILRLVTNHEICSKELKPRNYSTRPGTFYRTEDLAIEALRQVITNAREAVLKCIKKHSDTCDKNFHNCTCDPNDKVCTTSCESCRGTELNCGTCSSTNALSSATAFSFTSAVALQDGDCPLCCDVTQCETCDSTTGTCVSTCSACQTCQGGTCVDLCGPGTHCDPVTGSCVSICNACENYDPATNTCISTCGECMHCENGACVQTCTACEVCDSATNTCVSHCDGCMHCENGLCVRTCTDTEVCCGDQCINPSEFNCCITRDNGSLPCPNGYICCSGGDCCPPNMQCCGGQCVSYDVAHCAHCFPCNPGQVCCIGDEGQIYGCDTAGNCPR